MDNSLRECRISAVMIFCAASTAPKIGESSAEGEGLGGRADALERHLRIGLIPLTLPSRRHFWMTFQGASKANQRSVGERISSTHPSDAGSQISVG